jgi:hypothetical protein
VEHLIHYGCYVGVFYSLFYVGKTSFIRKNSILFGSSEKINVSMIGEKMRKLIMANAIGIPVVALGQELLL